MTRQEIEQRWMNLAREYYETHDREHQRRSNQVTRLFGGGRFIEVTPDRAVHLGTYRHLERLVRGTFVREAEKLGYKSLVDIGSLNIPFHWNGVLTRQVNVQSRAS